MGFVKMQVRADELQIGDIMSSTPERWVHGAYVPVGPTIYKIVSAINYGTWVNDPDSVRIEVSFKRYDVKTAKAGRSISKHSNWKPTLTLTVYRKSA
jgi:hypothetical protein